jgi:hypothetical protein
VNPLPGRCGIGQMVGMKFYGKAEPLTNWRRWRKAGIILMGAAGLALQTPGFACAAEEPAGTEVSVEGLDAAQYLAENPGDVAAPKGLFPVGKWMLDHDLKPASWLGYKVEQKTVREPINFILEIKGPASDEEAVAGLVALLSQAGYQVRTGHSGGYYGYINGRFFPQVPALRHHAFSNEPYEFTNNHGRLFGPYRYRGKYWFLGAFSREKVDSITKLEHVYVSFDQARDSVVAQLRQNTPCKLKAFVNLNNAILNSDEYTTGDHDGIAAWVALEE